MARDVQRLANGLVRLQILEQGAVLVSIFGLLILDGLDSGEVV